TCGLKIGPQLGLMFNHLRGEPSYKCNYMGEEIMKPPLLKFIKMCVVYKDKFDHV
ncbi:unnamed protein product, partial [Sphenostylis stenocarpa]